jgi:hypothetical protein
MARRLLGLLAAAFLAAAGCAADPCNPCAPEKKESTCIKPPPCGPCEDPCDPCTWVKKEEKKK